MDTALPGLESTDALKRAMPVLAGVEETLADLKDRGLLLPQHAALAASARRMAELVETAKAYSAVGAMAQLLAVLDRLPASAAGTSGTWEERAAQLLGETP